ncbi:MAG: transglutaminase-like domain-containing protein [Candidatus Heimdallarchaeaceae archaeon]
MSGKQQKSKKLKAGVKLKTKPAVVTRGRRFKRKEKKLSITAFEPKKINKWNIIFTLIFTSILVLTLVNAYIYEFFIIPFPPFFLKFIIPAVLFVEVFIVLLAFSTHKAKFKFSVLRIFFTLVTGLIFFPFTLVKYHTRYSVKRIMFTGIIIGSLLLSFFSPYFGLVGRYRDLPEGQLNEQEVNADWFNSLFKGSAPFYIDGLLDLLDALDINNSLNTQELGEVRAESGNLGDFLYRWDIKDRYDSTTWEFEASDAVRTALEPSDYGPTGDPDEVVLNITQTVYTATTSILGDLFTTWSSYYTPHLYDVTQDGYSWDDFFSDENGTNPGIATPGSTNIRFNNRDQLSLQSSTEYFGFVGKYNYKTYFALDDSTDKQNIISSSLVFTNDTTDNDPSLTSDYARFLQIPSNYETSSPLVISTARQWERDGANNGNSIYEQIVYIIDQILSYGFPTAADSDNQGQDRAQRFLDPAIQDRSFSAFIALAVMALRLNGIPARPVFGFAIGDPISGDSNHRNLALSNFYAWVEALIPVDFGSGTEYKWGQFQIGPYLKGSDLIYCENTLYSSYNVSVEMLSVPTQNYNGEDVYVTDYGVDYSIRATVTREGSPVDGVRVNFKTISVADLQTYQSNPGQLLSVATNIGSATSNSFGYALIHKTLSSANYSEFNPANPDATTYVILGFVSLSSYGGASFIVLPTGFLSSVSINTTKQTLPNPQNPLETFDYYIVQKGRNYQMSTILYEDSAHTTALSGRNVTYYILTQDELSQLLLGTLNPTDLTVIGFDITDSNGNSTIYSVNPVTHVDAFASLTLDTTYFIVANYGQNYTYTVMLIIDAVKSTIDFDASDLANFDLDVFLYTEPPSGSVTPLKNEPIEVWIAPYDVNYDTYSYTDAAGLQTYILSTYNSTAPLYPVRVMSPSGSTTDANGFYNDTFVVDKSVFGVGVFVVLIFYMDKWNQSSTFTISSSPAAFLNEENVQSVKSLLLQSYLSADTPLKLTKVKEELISIVSIRFEVKML